MTKRRSRSLALFLLVASFAAIPAVAQANHYSSDCEAARQALSVNNPNQLAPCSASPSATPTIPALNTKQMVQQQIAGTLIDAFVNMLFSNDSQANEQKQKMMAELQARQAEAERQKQLEEAMRLAAICSRLQATLKLSGLPQLQLKTGTQGNGGLSLKLGDSNDGYGGVQGLPGIALNDNSGNGGNTPYGIPGLPGIYTNGPATQPTPSSGLSLKLGESPSVPSIPAQQLQTATFEQSGLAPDPRNMTSQQLADLASSLSPEQQQQLVNALQSASNSNAMSGSVVHLSSSTTVSAAPPPTTTAELAASETNSTPAPFAGGASSAFGQLQQTSAASRAAAVAQTPEDAAAGARIGFDQAAGGMVSSAPPSGGSLAAPLTPSNASQSSAVNSTVAHTHSTATPATPLMVNMAVLAPPPPMPSASSNTAIHSSSYKANCVRRTEHEMPTREQLLTELAQRRTELGNLRQVVMRLNRSIQMDQKQFEMWQAEAEAGHDRAWNRVISLPTKLALDSLIELKEEQFIEKEARGPLTAADAKQKRMLERAGDLTTFDDFQKWVLEEKSDSEMYEDGMRQLIAITWPPEVQTYVNAAEDVIDNLYDLVDLKSTWENVDQLDRNSDRFLQGVKSNGERMKVLITRITQIESQLNGIPANVRLPYCDPDTANGATGSRQ
jgi:hypothetical protein